MAKKTNINDFLVQNQQSKKAKKSTIPELEHAKLADKFYSAYQTKKDAEALFRAIESEVLEITYKEYEKRTQEEFTKSFNIPGETTPGIQVSYKDQFESIPIEQRETIIEQLGELYDGYFEEKRTIFLEKTDDETIQLLLEKLGSDLFRKIFYINIEIVAKAELDRRQFEIPESVRPKQYKAAVKILKSE